MMKALGIICNTQYNRRRWLDFAISTATMFALYWSGAGWWALLAVPSGLWNYYDGATRSSLSREK